MAPGVSVSTGGRTPNGWPFARISSASSGATGIARSSSAKPALVSAARHARRAGRRPGPSRPRSQAGRHGRTGASAVLHPKPRETNFRPFANAQRRVGLFTHRDLAMRRQIWLTPIDGACTTSCSCRARSYAFGAYAGLGTHRRQGSGERAYGPRWPSSRTSCGLGNRLPRARPSPGSRNCATM